MFFREQIQIAPLSTPRSESCDFRVQVPSACDRHAKLRVDKNGKVHEKFADVVIKSIPS